MRIALRAFNGQFVCAEGGGGRELRANREVIRGWEMFDLIEHPDQNVSLRACNGKFVAAEGGGGRELVANRDTVAGWEIFKVTRQWQGVVSLRACNGRYVCAEGGGGRELLANRDVVYDWERFQLIVIDEADNNRVIFGEAMSALAIPFGKIAWEVVKQAVKTDPIGRDPAEQERWDRDRMRELQRRFNEAGFTEGREHDAPQGPRDLAGRTA